MYPKAFFSSRRQSEEPGTVFVLIPFAPEFSPVFEAIRRTVEGAALQMKCIRADDLYSVEPIMESILRGIARAEVVVADVTNRNANVFYELGIAHTVKDRCVVLTQSLADVPFDLRQLRCIEYQNTILGATKLTEALASAIGQLRSHAHPPDSDIAAGDARNFVSYFSQQEGHSAQDKRRLAKYVVAHLLEERDSVTLDAGTTCQAIAAEMLSALGRDPEATHYSILTHNCRAFEILAAGSQTYGLNLFLAGGRYSPNYNAFYGTLTEQAYLAFRPRVAILGASAISADSLFCHGNTDELSLKICLLRMPCHLRVLVVDHSKLGLFDGLRVAATQDLLVGAEECVVVTNAASAGNAARSATQHRQCCQALREIGLRVVEVEAQG